MVEFHFSREFLISNKLKAHSNALSLSSQAIIGNANDVAYIREMKSFVQGCIELQYSVLQEAQLMLTAGSTRLAVSRGQQTWYHSTCYI